MELPMRALRSKDFPQDRQTKLQNTLTPPSSPYHPHPSPRFITVQETPHCSRLWLTQFFFHSVFFTLFFLPISSFHSLTLLSLLGITAVDSG